MIRVQEIVRSHLAGVSIKSIEPIAGGVTGTMVAKVVLLRGSSSLPKRLVVKVGPRVTTEVAGYNFLANRSIAPYLPSVIFSGFDYVGLSFIQSVGTFAEVVARGQFSEDKLSAVFQEVLALKRELWTKDDELPAVQPVGPYRSILRAEFQETASVLRGFFHNDCPLPIVIGNDIYPSLENILAIISTFLYDEEPVHLVPSHGDLKGENILITPRGHLRVLDLEWSGQCDWVESLSRVGKWCSSKTSILSDKAVLTNENGYLALQYRIKHHPICRRFQQMAVKMGEEMAIGLGDDNWKRRWNYYLAASLLREIILLERRRLSPSIAIALLGETAKLVKRV